MMVGSTPLASLPRKYPEVHIARGGANTASANPPYDWYNVPFRKLDLFRVHCKFPVIRPGTLGSVRVERAHPPEILAIGKINRGCCICGFK